MNDSALLILSTFSDTDSAREIISRLLEEKLIACANILPGITSLYRWQGAVADDPEVLVILKTVPENYHRLEERLAELHPYEVPEIVALSAESVAPAYAAWLRESCLT